MDALCKLWVSGPFLPLLLPRAWVLEPIPSFVDAACMGFGTHSFIFYRYMHNFFLDSAADDIFSFEMIHFHVSFVIFSCPYLQSMSPRGIDCYRIPVG